MNTFSTVSLGSRDQADSAEKLSVGLPFRAVIFDLDDTLLRDDRTISPFTLSVLRSLSSKGIHLIPASGRAQLSLTPFVEHIGHVSLYICCNGAEIRDGKTHELLHAELFSAELGREIAAFGKRWGCYAQTYEGAHFFYNEESEWARRYAQSSMLSGVFVGDLESYINEPRNKILMMANPDKIADMLLNARETFRGRVSVTCSKPYFLEFNPLSATKGLALQRAAELLHLRPQDFLAFGDSLNDLSMLQAAGRGVLVANGRTDLRTQVDDICPSNEHDGVAEYLKSVFREVI